MAKSTDAGTAPAAPPDTQPAVHWREQCGASRGEHAGLMIHVGWDVHSRVSKEQYEQGLAAFRKAAA